MIIKNISPISNSDQPQPTSTESGRGIGSVPPRPQTLGGLTFEPFAFNILSQTEAGHTDLTEPYEGYQDHFQPAGDGAVAHELSPLVGGFVINAAPFVQKGKTRLALPVSLHVPYYHDKRARWDTESMMYDWAGDPVPTDTETYEYLFGYGAELSVKPGELVRPYVSASMVPWKQYHLTYKGIDDPRAINTAEETGRTYLDKGVGAILGAGAHFETDLGSARFDRRWLNTDLDLGLRLMMFEDNIAIGGGMSFGAGVNSKWRGE
ncbi:MAG: hypothetical protein ACD_62C00521G0003 [uncultured bacterium]|nr:MAG: hypothetical protein ACD_62C00521G0003 [uncultured bacterium]